jgi:hypothetical protein
MRGDETMTNQWTERIFRQGDLLIRRVWQIPTDAVAKSGNSIGEGEKVGYHHQLIGAHKISETPDDGTIYFEAKEEVSLDHPEHNTIQIPKGVYVVVHERSFSPFEQRDEEVFD